MIESGLSSQLHAWQAEKDELLWKIIISPEFGERADLQRLTNDLMQRMEEDLGHRLEWTSVVHRNTDHPHVHVALRGRTGGGIVLRLSRDYIKHGFRETAEELCTRQLGFRTSLDAEEARLREIKEMRFTSLDRQILRDARQGEAWIEYWPLEQTNAIHVAARLGELKKMDLAQDLGTGAWLIQSNAEQVLRAMQRTNDRQKTLAANGVPPSDPRLPIEVLNWRETQVAEGRVLVHGQDEQSGKSYLMLESTSAKVYYVPYTREMEEARHRGGLKSDSFVRLRKIFTDAQPWTQIEEFGTSEGVLSNRRLLREKVQRLRSRKIVPSEDGWTGWLGRYQQALVAEFFRDEDRRIRTRNSPER